MNIEYGDFVKYSFYKIRSEWFNLSGQVRMDETKRLCLLVDRMTVESDFLVCSATGTRADVDFLTVHVAKSVETFHNVHRKFNQTLLGRYLEQRFSYLAIRRKTQYKHGGGRAPEDPGKYFIVYPMVKKREWYTLPQGERQRMMNEHFQIGRKYPEVKINTTYSFGLDDPEFVVAFETDHPERFVSLVMELRGTEASQYTMSETPIFTTIKTTLHEALVAAGA